MTTLAVTRRSITADTSSLAYSGIRARTRITASMAIKSGTVQANVPQNSRQVLPRVVFHASFKVRVTFPTARAGNSGLRRNATTIVIRYNKQNIEMDGAEDPSEAPSGLFQKYIVPTNPHSGSAAI